MGEVTWNRVRLWCRIIGRKHWADGRCGPVLAWQLACIVWPTTTAPEGGEHGH